MQTVVEERQMVDVLWSLVRVGQAMHATLNVQEQLPLILDAAIDLTGAQVALLALKNASGVIEIVAQRHGEGVRPNDGAQFSRTIIDEVIALDQPKFILDTQGSGDDKRASVQSLRLRSVMAAPLQSRAGAFGALYVHSLTPVASFDESKQELFMALRGMASVALDNARLIVDDETGLYTYSYGMRRMAEESSAASKRHQRLAFALVGASGDMRAVSDAVRAAMRRVDIALRYDRDHVAVIMPDASDDSVASFVARMQATGASIDIKG